MIRIKFGRNPYYNYSNKVIEFESDYQCRERLSNSYGYNTIVNSITKVEKQVKDLTLDEMCKLGIVGIIAIDGRIGTIYNLYYCEHINFSKNPEDYIDITPIIKGKSL